MRKAIDKCEFCREQELATFCVHELSQSYMGAPAHETLLA